MRVPGDAQWMGKKPRKRESSEDRLDSAKRESGRGMPDSVRRDVDEVIICQATAFDESAATLYASGYWEKLKAIQIELDKDDGDAPLRIALAEAGGVALVAHSQDDRVSRPTRHVPNQAGHIGDSGGYGQRSSAGS